MLQFMGSQRVGHDLATEQQTTYRILDGDSAVERRAQKRCETVKSKAYAS